MCDRYWTCVETSRLSCKIILILMDMVVPLSVIDEHSILAERFGKPEIH